MDTGHLIAAIGALAGGIVVLWRLDRGRLVDDLEKARLEAQAWQQKWSEEVKARAKDTEKFLILQRRKSDASSDPPPTSS